MSELVIYAIRHTSGKQYIGSTARWSTRQREHRGRLRAGRHCNPHLQAAWNKHGEDQFEFVVLEVISSTEQLIPREQHWIDHTRACAEGYNLLAQAVVDGARVPGALLIPFDGVGQVREAQVGQVGDGLDAIQLTLLVVGRGFALEIQRRKQKG